MLRILILAAWVASAAVAQEAPPPFASFDRASDPVLADPHDLAFGPDGNLYVADKFANRVAILNPETLELIGSIGDGALVGAHDVSFGADGQLYVAATGLNGVVTYDLSEGVPKNQGILGPFPRTEGALAHRNGRLYVMASGTGELYAIEGDRVAAVTGGMFGAHDVAEGPDGSVWVADNARQRIIRFDPDLNRLGELSGPAYGFIGPRYIDFDADGILYVADQDAHRVLKIDSLSGDLLGVLGSGRPGLGPNLFDDPEGVAVREGVFYISDSDNNRIVRYVVLVN